MTQRLRNSGDISASVKIMDMLHLSVTHEPTLSLVQIPMKSIGKGSSRRRSSNESDSNTPRESRLPYCTIYTEFVKAMSLSGCRPHSAHSQYLGRSSRESLVIKRRGEPFMLSIPHA